MIWALSTSGVNGGLGTLEDGSCERTKKLTFWIHFAINVLGTLLLGASNYTMQCLSSPTRCEVDIAHSQGVWLDIGVPSYKNLRRLSSSRITLWWLLAVSSIPLHLLYNSAVFSTLSTRGYSVFIVASDFVNGATFNVGQTYDSTSVDTSWLVPWQQRLQKYQADQGLLLKLDNEACIKQYQESFISTNADLVVVTEATNSTNSLIGFVEKAISGIVVHPKDRRSWMCNTPFDKPCTVSPAANKSDWSIATAPTGDLSSISTNSVQYCLSQKVPEHCKLQFSMAIMIVVIICNIVKAGCMGLVAWKKSPEPLVTLGDAISSFLDRADPTTEGNCLNGKSHFESTNNWIRAPSQWHPNTLNWFQSASKRRWIVCNTL